ncbi:MAG: hypothetical protein IKO57_13125 [Treponema sp.]|nr:hypothetical protein [Treponema sp.]
MGGCRRRRDKGSGASTGTGLSPGSSARTGIHRSYFSRWLARYRKGGGRALETKSRSPKRKEIIVMAGKEVPTREITFARDEN